MLQSLRNNIEPVYFFALDHLVHTRLDISSQPRADSLFG